MYFDDFKIGDRFVTRTETVTEADIVDFGRRFDPQYFHVDPEAARASHFGGVIASGFHMLAISFRLFFDMKLLDGNLSSPGMDQVRWLKPLKPGDTIRQECEVTDLVPSKSKPDRGIVKMRHTTLNAAGEALMTVDCMHYITRRPRG